MCTDHFVLRHGVVGADLLEVLVTLLGGDGAVPGLVLGPAVLPHHLALLALLLPVVVRHCAVPGRRKKIEQNIFEVQIILEVKKLQQLAMPPLKKHQNIFCTITKYFYRTS